MFDPDDGWTGANNPKLDSTLVPIEFEDLVVAQDPDAEWTCTIVCNRCGGKISYYFDARYPNTKEFSCTGRIYNYATIAWETCELSWSVESLNGMTLSQIRSYMCLEIYKKKEKKYCLDLEEHKGTTAYTYVRELTEEESWEEQKVLLEQIRQKIRNPKA